ncbi:hypothetical protein KSS87_009318, partial [Heliosperma pusillum]
TSTNKNHNLPLHYKSTKTKHKQHNLPTNHQKHTKLLRQKISQTALTVLFFIPKAEQTVVTEAITNKNTETRSEKKSQT